MPAARAGSRIGPVRRRGKRTAYMIDRSQKIEFAVGTGIIVFIAACLLFAALSAGCMYKPTIHFHVDPVGSRAADGPVSTQPTNYHDQVFGVSP